LTAFNNSEFRELFKPTRMAIIACIKTSELWIAYSGITIAYFLVIFLYSVIPIFLYYQQFVPLPALNRWTRIGISISVALRCVCHVIAIPLGLTINATDHVSVYVSGLILIEFPAYVIATCYSILLLFWLSVCAQILPLKYVPRLRVMRRVLIAFNIVAYIVLIGSIGINSRSFAGDAFMEKLQDRLAGFASLARDLLLVIILLLFVIHLKISIGGGSDHGETIDEKKLQRFSIMLAVTLLCRGLISLGQGIFFQGGRDTSCAVSFWVMVMVQELVLEGVPFIVLIRTNTQYLVEQQRYADKHIPLLVTSLDDVSRGAR
jgi:hypothetical protein